MNNLDQSTWSFTVYCVCFGCYVVELLPAELHKPCFACALWVLCLARLLIFQYPYVHASRHGLTIDLSSGI